MKKKKEVLPDRKPIPTPKGEHVIPNVEDPSQIPLGRAIVIAGLRGLPSAAASRKHGEVDDPEDSRFGDQDD